MFDLSIGSGSMDKLAISYKVLFSLLEFALPFGYKVLIHDIIRFDS
jgi:hypothetical protein